MRIITAKKVWAQIKFDLIGKDSYRGVSLTYSWLANQFGHFSLAFITTFALYHILLHFTCIAKPAFWAGIGIAAAWFVFECFNFLGPLWLNKSKHATKNVQGGYTFQPEWKNIAYDTATDVLFFGLGAFSMSLSLAYDSTMLYILLALIAVALYPIRDWYLTKMYQQAAGYPFQFRLSQWNNTINEEQKQVIVDFVNTNETGKHLLIFGANNTGKTSLSVAIANERSIKHNTCSYTTAMKLISLFYEANIDINAPKSLDLWAWRNASLLIIDDVNPGVCTNSSIINSSVFGAFLNNQKFGSANIATMQNSSAIWVLGNGNCNDEISTNWVTMLTQIGVKQNNITCINL
jgi:hypothetical protein